MLKTIFFTAMITGAVMAGVYLLGTTNSPGSMLDSQLQKEQLIQKLTIEIQELKESRDQKILEMRGLTETK